MNRKATSFDKRMSVRFRQDQHGGTAVLLALALPALLGVGGVAVDYSSGMRQKAALQSAVDAGSMNAARELIISEPTPDRVTAVATRTVDAMLLDKKNQAKDWVVTVALAADRKAVTVTAKRTVKPVFGVLNALYGFQSGASGFEAEARSTARLAHNSKLCLLTLGDNDTSISIEIDARLTGKECSIHSNSRSNQGIKLADRSRLTSDLVCSRGGIQNLGSTVNSDILYDCPPVLDPLRNRPIPMIGSCTQPTRLVIKTGIVTLNPGVYCGGIEIRNTAQVKLNPGIYVIQNGDLLVRNDASLTGTYVGLFFNGDKSYFRFSDNALIDLVAPKDGAMAGILLWRNRIDNLADKKADKSVTLQNAITANRAMRLTGTIYLPEGSLYIAAKAPVAQVSDYTVILARRVSLADGPELVLNTNYGGSDVPVPQDLGPIGLKDLRLER